MRSCPAQAGQPVVILSDSGGAATAILDYIQGGIEYVHDKFQPHEETLRKIKTINEAYGSTTGPEEPRTGHWPTASRPCDQARAVG